MAKAAATILPTNLDVIMTSCAPGWSKRCAHENARYPVASQAAMGRTGRNTAQCRSLPLDPGGLESGRRIWMRPPMAGDSPAPSNPPPDRLDSWKEIAAYLKRDVTTVQRWEKRESMPVHRHLHDKLGSVYAFRSELDAWVRRRTAQTTNGGPIDLPVTVTVPDTAPTATRATRV